ncbi:protein tyrosine phosphatase [Syntrophobotulus glycolicus DSM 8271]|uniref:Protein tyrosine phosphatase n=1 Tax=Syntrophobotulus glycolicus (strain DSM 8271 / FlGlyR) TaxID=645991 RepID=F0T2C0_SYNGF|nr:low molecular weight protein arginine phosphatase [Syntrophobotulus glycolicus]ADY57548.1 protein tyrosine phosphatase [Syntrophobotulus glycolicus DSM 8271]
MNMLFVCTGNTCRSPMAAGLAGEIFPEEFSIGSAGLNAWEGSAASHHAVLVMEEEGIDLNDHCAAMITEGKLAWADWIVPMTSVQERQLKISFPEFGPKIKRLGIWAGKDKDVSDPWGGSVEEYCFCREELKEMLKEMAKVLTKGKGADD